MFIGVNFHIKLLDHMEIEVQGPLPLVMSQVGQRPLKLEPFVFQKCNDANLSIFIML